MNFLSEFLGTLFLILLGNGAVYSATSSRMVANQPGKWIIISFGWGLAVLVGLIISSAFKGLGHLNPAVTVYDAIASNDLLKFALIPFQFLGAIVGQILLNFINWRHIGITELKLVRSAHSTNPAFGSSEKSAIFNFAYEFVATMVFLGTILALSRGANPGSVLALGHFPIAFLIIAIAMSLGSSTGFAINPARDLGPRIVYFFMEKFCLKSRASEHIGANFAYSWIPVIAPLIAGIFIGFFALI
ncbi:aquaporin family protein [Mycoplasma sp. 'Moose RK']|nr:aquaporin family protein [Mycoplasma sp. 'Moose RK']